MQITKDWVCETSADKMTRTYMICIPIVMHTVWIPDRRRKVGSPLIDVDKFYKLGIQMRISERAICHERIIEMFWISVIPLQSEKIGEFRLARETVNNIASNRGEITYLDVGVVRRATCGRNSPVRNTGHGRRS